VTIVGVVAKLRDVIYGGPLTTLIITLAQKVLFARSNAMGMMEKSDKANVMMPMVMPPVRSVTQQQHRFRHGIVVVVVA